MRLRDRSLLAVTVSACCLAPSWGFAGCNRPIVVPVRFQQGAACWQHVGVGTTFTGQFGARQRVSAAAIGHFVNADGKREWVTTGHWQISLSGPDGFFANGENGELETPSGPVACLAVKPAGKPDAGNRHDFGARRRIHI
jgi:hypothetical protein